MTVDQIWNAWMKSGNQSVMPIGKEVVRDFVGSMKNLEGKSEAWVVDMLFDFVGSQMRYEEGSEECW